VKIFPLGASGGGAGALNVNLGPPYYLGNYLSYRKLILKTQLYVVKYSLQVQKFSREGHPGGARPPNVNLGPVMSGKLLQVES